MDKKRENKVATTDFYYANVLSDWPEDNDVMQVDLDVDLYVGRIPVRNSQEFNIFLQKYKNYRFYKTEYSGKMAFISTNIMKVPCNGEEDSIIDVIITGIDTTKVEIDYLHSSALTDTINGPARIVMDKLKARDYGFLYGTWHGGDCYVIYDNQFHSSENWWEYTYKMHDQYITIEPLEAQDGYCYYSEADTSGTHIGQHQYRYQIPAKKFLSLQNELPDEIGNTYVAWFGTCYTADLNYKSFSIPVQKDSLGNVIVNYDENGQLFEYYVDTVPDTVWNTENNISVVFFNQKAGPIAINATSIDDRPFITDEVVKRYMELQFQNNLHTLGRLTQNSWQVLSEKFIFPFIRSMYIGYTLFGDPSMEVWSEKAKKLVLRADGTKFTAMNEAGVPIKATICILDNNSTLLDKGNSPYTSQMLIPDTDIIVANAANYIQNTKDYGKIKEFAKIPYKMGFENGIDHNWIAHSDDFDKADIKIVKSEGIGESNYLLMSSNKDSSQVTNSIWLYLNLQGLRNVTLSYKWRTYDTVTGNDNYVFLSSDGGEHFVKTKKLEATSGRWEDMNILLDDYLGQDHLEFNDKFIIKFQYKTDMTADTGGICIDDVCVDSRRSETLNENIDITKLKFQNNPNPFNPETKISFELQKDEKVNLSVYNMKGQKIKTLLSGKMEKGLNSVTWNGTNEQGKSVSSGIYLFKLKISNKKEIIRKGILLK